MIDYQNTNDPVLSWFDNNHGMGELKEADIVMRAKSDKELSYRHAGPISSGSIFWKELKKQIDKLFVFEKK